ncbi:unnamed protein product [Ambrosiozyma monospora]|uniref:Unnamed protein product n=1 Tax=Ambrosiozyma monospora TaxID=43982 RepID=A0A9W6Z149_AMBMO|nr:unnamed protein product [Ambrosiozyma monospora]
MSKNSKQAKKAKGSHKQKHGNKAKAHKAKAHKDAVVTQIGDGQIQAGTGTASSASKTTSASSASKTTSASKSAGPSSSCVYNVVTSYSSSCYISSAVSKQTYNTDFLITQISDGQIQWGTDAENQATVAVTSTYQQCTTVPYQVTQTSCTALPSSTVPGDTDEGDDGQIYAYVIGSVDQDDGTLPSSCASESSARFTITDGIIYDDQGRLGAIVSNSQFQFDGPPPQAGAIYAGGFSVTDDYFLALGDDDTGFFGCPQDDTYKIYYGSPYNTCVPVYVKVYEFDDSC